MFYSQTLHPHSKPLFLNLIPNPDPLASSDQTQSVDLWILWESQFQTYQTGGQQNV